MRDQVGPQPLRNRVAERLLEGIHQDPRAGRRLEQEAGLAVPGQLAHGAIGQFFDVLLDHDGATEHRMCGPHRLIRKPFGRSDNRLRQHLGALDHLALVVSCDARRSRDAIGTVGLHVEQVEQACTDHCVCADSVVMLICTFHVAESEPRRTNTVPTLLQNR